MTGDRRWMLVLAPTPRKAITSVCSDSNDWTTYSLGAGSWR